MERKSNRQFWIGGFQWFYVFAITLVVIPILAMLSVADLGGARPARAGPKIFSISCSFYENLAKSYVGAPRGLANPGSAPGYNFYWATEILKQYKFYIGNDENIASDNAAYSIITKTRSYGIAVQLSWTDDLRHCSFF